ncbi:MAG: TspO/MBR family protein [Lentisphaerae bacterium ADurb.BinA184]|nr:MAG: TspO/MBR family protein [Lentisphaerae bacterium ADurb.BinA184]
MSIRGLPAFSRESVIMLVVSLALVAGVAAVGAYAVPGAWYATLAKPSWNPPDWVFAPVWTVLYLFMAVAAWLVWRERPVRRIGFPIFCYLLQLLLNGAWTWLFFGLKRIDLALIDLVALWLVLLVTTMQFGQVRRPAGALLLPCLLWVTFAGALNLALLSLNRG